MENNQKKPERDDGIADEQTEEAIDNYQGAKQESIAPLMDSKEFFSLELPSGYKIGVGSSVIRADLLCNLVLETYDILTKDQPNKRVPVGVG